jgi:hypothetical protein
VDWRRHELERLGVTVHLDAYVEADEVMAERPDLVIVATGGTPDINWIPGAEHCPSVDPQLAQELTNAERVIWKKRAYELGLAITFEHQIEKVERRGNRILATFGNFSRRLGGGCQSTRYSTLSGSPTSGHTRNWISGASRAKISRHSRPRSSFAL